MDYEIDKEVIATLLEDDILVEILAAVRQEEDTSTIDAEKDGYVPIPDPNDDGES